MQPFALPIRVYIEDTDAGGIVYYVNYLKYMERARTEYLRSMGYDKPAVFDHQLMFVVHSLSVTYHRSAELDDQLQVTARMLKASRVSFLLEQKVIRNEELLCEAEVKIACIRQIDRQPAVIPTAMQAKFRTVITPPQGAVDRQE